MEQNFKDQEVLLVKEQGVDEVRAVSRIGEGGSLKTLPADTPIPSQRRQDFYSKKPYYE